MSGLVALTGFPESPPTHVGMSLGDTTTGLMGALGIMIALFRQKTRLDPTGDVIDLALFETLFRLIEWQVPAYDQLGFVGTRQGNRFPFGPAIVANAYLTCDGVWITISTATQRAVQLCVDMLGDDASEYVAHRTEPHAADMLDEAIRGWIGRRTKTQALEQLVKAGVVAQTIYDVRDIVNDETYRVRRDIVTVPDRDLGTMRQPAAIPHFLERPGAVWREAPLLGADNDQVYASVGVTADERAHLESAGLI
jgi:formyl-CoA transferase